MTAVSVYEARTHLARLLRRVRKGEEIAAYDLERIRAS
jgi:antitoxin (DNA-binding transcriptional repressor) of toxin-antitoxin stability system